MKGDPKHILIGTIIIMVLILFASYKFAYSPSIEEAEKIEKDNKALEQRKAELEEKQMNKTIYLERIDNAEKIINSVFKKYGPGFKPEKTIMTLVDAADSSGSSVASISFSDDTVLYTNGTASEDGSEEAKNVLFVSNSTVEINSGYTQFKKVVDFINNYPERINIESFNIMFDTEENLINASMVLNLFGVADENHEYVDPIIVDVPIGTTNIFGYTQPATEEGEEGLEGTEENNVSME